jgi:aldose 1-epimerase
VPDGAQLLTSSGAGAAAASPTPGATPPSGEQIEIAFRHQRAVIVEVGGGIRSYSLWDREILDGYGIDGPATSGRGQVLIPWPNRLQDGTYEFDGRSHQLALTEPVHSNAIHGLVRWVPWRVAEREPHRVVVQHVVHPQPGYPFTLAISIEYVLAESGLAVRTTATNIGAVRCPFGAGAHPYLQLGTPTVDALFLRVPARRVLLFDPRGLPIGSEEVDGTEYDFRFAGAIGGTKLDNAFTDLERDQHGIARLVLRNAAGSELSVWVNESYPYLMVFTGDTLADVNRRSIAVEPMTCPPNAFRTGEGVRVLEPGESTTGEWGIEARL